MGPVTWTKSHSLKLELHNYVITSYIYLFIVNRKFGGGQEIVISIPTTGCAGQDNEINYLEHVQLYTTIEHSKRGTLEIYLKSPASPPGVYYNQVTVI